MDIESNTNINDKITSIVDIQAIINTINIDDQFMKDAEFEELTLESKIDSSEQFSIKYIDNAYELIKARFENVNIYDNTDLIKNIYEGGFKLWECTYDLLELMFDNKIEFNLSGKNIMDLGCGHGLLGILSLCLGASTVTFQDFNLEVLKFGTLPNLIINNWLKDIHRCRFISGDWSDVVRKLSLGSNELPASILEDQKVEFTRKFDLILMSEVLYNVENYEKLVKLIIDILDEKGTCIISSKIYYFGVGGSTLEFKEFLANNYPSLKIKILREIKNKVSNKREIFAISF